MKTVKYVPAACRGDGRKFDGFITLNPVSFEQKYDYLDELKLKIGEDGKIDMGDTSDKLRHMKNLVRIAKTHFVSVDIKKLSDGEEFKTYEDLSYDSDCHDMLLEVAGTLLNGFKVGNV